MASITDIPTELVHKIVKLADLPLRNLDALRQISRAFNHLILNDPLFWARLHFSELPPLRCTGSQELVEERTEFLSKIYRERSNMPLASTVQDTVLYLQELVCDVPTIDLTARFAHRVLKIYAKVPMYIPAEYLIRD